MSMVVALEQSANLLETLAAMLRSGDYVDEETLDSVKDQILLAQKSFNGFIAESNFKIIGKDTGRSRSTYIKDCASYKRTYEMLKSQINYINSTLQNDKSSRMLIIAPEFLGGTDSLYKLRDSESVNVCGDLTAEEQIQFGITKDNYQDHVGMRKVHSWLLDRIIDPSRVTIIDGKRQLFKEENVAIQVKNAISNGITDVCFFFQPSRNHRRFKFECAPLTKTCNNYCDAEVRWITWIIDLLRDNLEILKPLNFIFSRDYTSTVNSITAKYGCTIDETEDNHCSEDQTDFISNRVDYIIATVHPNKNDYCFYNLVEYCKSELKSGSKSIECTIADLMKIMKYEINKPSNVEYKLTRKVYNDIFKIECIDSSGSSRNHRYRIQFSDKFFEVNKSITAEKFIESTEETNNVTEIINAPNFVDDNTHKCIIENKQEVIITENKESIVNTSSSQKFEAKDRSFFQNFLGSGSKSVSFQDLIEQCKSGLSQYDPLYRQKKICSDAGLDWQVVYA